MAHETEFKFQVRSPQVFDQIRSLTQVAGYKLTDQKMILQRDTYFDTPTGLLSQQGISLRLREKQGQYLVAFKSQINGTYVRREIETQITESQAQDLFNGSFADIHADAIQAIVSNIGAQTLAPVLHVENRREVWHINSESGRIEICFDDVQYTPAAGGQCQFVTEYELELELKEGEDTFLQEIAQALSQQYELIPYSQSKYERGVMLLNVFTPTG